MTDTQERFTTISTPRGTVKCRRYEYGEKTYVQKEATVLQTLDLTALVAESGALDGAGDADMFSLDMSAVINALARKRRIGDALAIILTYEDGSAVPPNELMDGTINEWLPFVEEVITDFFSLNTTLAATITKYVGAWLTLRLAAKRQLETFAESAISQMGGLRK